MGMSGLPDVIVDCMALWESLHMYFSVLIILYTYNIYIVNVWVYGKQYVNVLYRK